MLKSLYRVPEIDGHSNIEIQVSNGCNLTCQSCSHYTNVGFAKNIDAKTVREWIGDWNERILPKNFILMGGEPTLNKNLVEIAELSARVWAFSKIKIVTNGFFLEKHPELPALMQKFNLNLEISLKSNDKEYLERIEPVKRLVDDWRGRFKIRVKWRKDYENWLMVYKGYGPEIRPFNDNEPKKSFESCGQKVCRVLHEGDIWKCPRLAYLHLYKFKLDDSWSPYLKYRPLKAGASAKEIKSFFEQKEIPECAMCPARKHPMELPNPIISARELLR
jgi:sulfatase maturation enzyme AslB (radical SAM superfamily)